MTINPELAEAYKLLETGDVPGALRRLRGAVEEVAPADTAELVARAARAAGLEELTESCEALAAAPQDAEALHRFGWACVEHGLSFLAVPALRAALRAAPEHRGVLMELTTALEREGRHAEVVALLSEREPALPAWPEGYLLAYNAVMAGELETARRAVAALPAPVGDDEKWAPAVGRVARMLERADSVREFTPLDGMDLRGWHYVLTGGLLTTLSPYGFTEAMRGRWAYVQDTLGRVRFGLERLRETLAVTGVRPEAVALLPDRGSRLLGLAAACLLGLPAEPYAPQAPRPGRLVVAYDLNEADEETLTALAARAPGEVLFEHASCWTDPPGVSADVVTFLAQTCVPPWAEQLRVAEGGGTEQAPADDRPEEEIVAELLTTASDADEEGDGDDGPVDPEGVFAAFAAVVRPAWLTAPRDGVRSSGPVRSGRFS